jgi:hypothetical protein
MVECQAKALSTLGEGWEKMLSVDRESRMVGSGSVAQVGHHSQHHRTLWI